MIWKIKMFRWIDRERVGDVKNIDNETDNNSKNNNNDDNNNDN